MSTSNFCYVRPELEEGRVWGIMIQLYALRSRKNLGVGDLGDLETVGHFFAGQGARILLLNPLHALHPANPRWKSPYSASNRNFLHYAVIHLPWLADWDGGESFLNSEDLAWLEQDFNNSHVDYEACLSRKFRCLETVFERFQAGTERKQAFQTFIDSGGEALRRQAVFDALYEFFLKEKGFYGFKGWPEEFQDPESLAVADFARQRAERVEFYLFLQWLTREQLERVRESLDRVGIKLCLDQAVGPASDGAEVWSRPERYETGANIGAPPDPYAPQGQDWGLTPFRPEKAVEAFRDLLRANMPRGGFLRLDHTMLLERLYFRFAPAQEKQDVYVDYPLAEMLGALAEVSRERECMVIGEALGTVSDGFRERIREQGVYTWEVIYFQKRNDSEYLPADEYPELSAAAVNTHDLPTLRGYIRALDVDLRRKLELFTEQEAKDLREERKRDLDAFLEMIPESGEDEQSLVSAYHRFLNDVKSKVVLVNLYDLVGPVEQVNLPGTVDEYDNWSLRYELAVEDFEKQPDLEGVLALFGERNSG